MRVFGFEIISKNAFNFAKNEVFTLNRCKKYTIGNFT